MRARRSCSKRFADVDGWPIPLSDVRVDGETGKSDPDKVVETAARLAVMYGGINLEDIAAPAVFRD